MRSILVAFGVLGMLVASAGRASASTITLTGIVRDFSAREPNDPNGTPDVLKHPDFERNPQAPTFLPAYAGNGLKLGMVADQLGADGKPVLVGRGCGTGATANECSIESADSFSKWYNDDPLYNLSKLLTITLNETSPGLFTYASDAFFPIDDQLFGNQGFNTVFGPNPVPHNYHFTFELHTEFTYVAGQLCR